MQLKDLPLAYRTDEGSPRLFADQCLAENVLERHPSAQVIRNGFRRDGPPGAVGQVVVNDPDAVALYRSLVEAASDCPPLSDTSGSGGVILVVRSAWSQVEGRPAGDESSRWAVTTTVSSNTPYDSPPGPPTLFALVRQGETLLWIGGTKISSELESWVSAALD